MKKYAGAEIQTHDLLTHVVLLQLVPFIAVVWPFSDLTSCAPSGSQYSGGPGSHCSHLYGHRETLPEPVHPERVAVLGFTYNPMLPGLPKPTLFFFLISLQVR